MLYVLYTVFLKLEKENVTKKTIRENTFTVLYCMYLKKKKVCKWTRVVQTHVVQRSTVYIKKYVAFLVSVKLSCFIPLQVVYWKCST